MKITEQINNPERLKSLDSYKIVDTPTEEEYDDITKIASAICHAPIALISLVDQEKQFFKSHYGLAINETPVKDSFCAVAIGTETEIMIVEDARKDERFSKNPLVIDNPNIVFYAGVILKTQDDFALGTLCIIDHKPRNLSPQQLDLLKRLRNQVVKLLELRKKNMLLKASEKKLKLLAEEKENFAYVASHDLKEPLRIIKSFIQLFNDNYTDTVPEEGKKYIEYALDGANRLDQLIFELLEFSSIEQKHNDIRELHIANIVEDIKKLLYNPDKPVIIDYYGPLYIKASETVVKQTLQNLISNGIKYQKKASSPRIIVSVDERKKHWEISVRDNGIGIPHDKLESIFILFKRLHRKEEYPGTGIGLATCKKLITNYGGKIWAESELGKGSTFIFSIPKK